MYLGSALIGVLAAAVAIPVFALGQGGDSGGTVVEPNFVALVDAQSNSVVDSVQVGARPLGVAIGEGSVWVANLDDGTISRIDPKTREVVHTVTIDVEPTGLAAGAGGIWFASAGASSYVKGGSQTTFRLGHIDPVFNTPAATTELHHPAFDVALGPVAADRRTVWLTTPSGGVVRFEPATGRETIGHAAAVYGSKLTGITVGAGATWVSDGGERRVVRLDPTGLLIEKIPVGNGPSAITVGEGSVWVADTPDNEVRAIDPTTNSGRTTFQGRPEPDGDRHRRRCRLGREQRRRHRDQNRPAKRHDQGDRGRRYTGRDRGRGRPRLGHRAGGWSRRR